MLYVLHRARTPATPGLESLRGRGTWPLRLPSMATMCCERKLQLFNNLAILLQMSKVICAVSEILLFWSWTMLDHALSGLDQPCIRSLTRDYTCENPFQLSFLAIKRA